MTAAAATVLDADGARAALTAARTIAVLGASDRPARAGHYVPAYLAAQGYRVIPVNPAHVGARWWGEPVRATLSEIREPVDIVDVFRHGSHLPAHVDDLLAMDPVPGLVWLQLGVDHPGFRASMALAGIPLVVDRCTLADHRAFGLPQVVRRGW